jgi:hypothetical protein
MTTTSAGTAPDGAFSRRAFDRVLDRAATKNPCSRPPSVE